MEFTRIKHETARAESEALDDFSREGVERLPGCKRGTRAEERNVTARGSRGVDRGPRRLGMRRCSPQ
jgi:hypothetical protein